MKQLYFHFLLLNHIKTRMKKLKNLLSIKQKLIRQISGQYKIPDKII